MTDKTQRKSQDNRKTRVRKSERIQRDNLTIREMAKLNNHEQQLLSTEYGSNAINMNVIGSVVTFPSNHHLLVRHAAIEISPPPVISHSQHHLNTGNSFELNGVTTSSLSEDSGLPLTTNSSISSGDSTRMGLCKFEFEVMCRCLYI